MEAEVKAELKTKASGRSVARFLQGIQDEQRRADCQTVLEIMKKATGAEPKMWGSSVVGFGEYHYKYASGREGDWFVTGFSPRKQDLTLYLLSGVERHSALLKKLGKCRTGKGCLYIKNLEDVHVPTLRKLIQESVRRVTKGVEGSGSGISQR
jgi:hypothetical protein